jgi:hypothetical protein
MGNFSASEFQAAKKEQMELLQKESVARNDLTDRVLRAYLAGIPLESVSNSVLDLEELSMRDVKDITRRIFLTES